MISSPSLERTSWIAIGAGSIALLVGFGLAIQPRPSQAASWPVVIPAHSVMTLNRIADHHAVKPALKGRSYREARSILLKEGWMPQRNPIRYGESREVQTGNGPVFWDEGYHELAACSGTGYGLCRFEYNDAPGDHTLVVITAGEENPDQDVAAVVDRVFLDKRLVQTSAGK